MPGSPSLVGRAPGNFKTIERVLAREREFKSLSRRLYIIKKLEQLSMEKYDITIIGGGILGNTISYWLSTVI